MSFSKLRRAAGAMVRRLRDRRDARLHPGRSRELKKRLRGMSRPQRILVVCHGNICRSPYLEAVLRRALPDVTVTSAGFVGAGRGVPEHSLTLATKVGLDLSGHRSRLLTREMLTASNLIVVMDHLQAQALMRGFDVEAEDIVIAGDLDPISGKARAIRDPWGQPLEVFEASFARLERCARSLADALKGGAA